MGKKGGHNWSGERKSMEAASAAENEVPDKVTYELLDRSGAVLDQVDAVHIRAAKVLLSPDTRAGQKVAPKITV